MGGSRVAEQLDLDPNTLTFSTSFDAQGLVKAVFERFLQHFRQLLSEIRTEKGERELRQVAGRAWGCIVL